MRRAQPVSVARYASLLLLALCCGSALGGLSLTGVGAQTLQEQPLNLPQDLAGKHALFVIGFSHEARKATEVWSKQLAAECAGRGNLQCYDVAIIEEVPKLIRGFVSGRIRKGVPESRHANFLLVSDNSAAWRAAAGFIQSDKDAPYLLLIDGAGEVIWSGHGIYGEALSAQLQAALP